MWVIVGGESFLRLNYWDRGSGKTVYARKKERKRKREDDFSSTRKSMTSLLVFLCPIMSVDIGEKEERRVMGLEILAGPMRRGRGRERCIHYLLFSDCIRRCIHYLSFSERNRTIYISLAGKLRENIRMMVDKLLTSSFCVGCDSRANIYKTRGSRIRFESPRWFLHKEGHSSNVQV